MKKQRIMNWMLNFVDASLEKGFSDSKIPYQNSALKIVIFEGFIMIFISWLINPYNKPLYEGTALYSLLGIVALTFISMIVARFKKKIVENSILVLILSYVILLLETSKKINANWEGATFFIAGAMIEIISATPIWAKVSWRKSTLLFILINLLCSIRYTDFSTNYRTRYQPLVHFIGNTLILMISSYLSEKNDRARYFEMKAYERSLTSFKELIKDVFPTPIIITKEDKILFENSQALKEFQNEQNESTLNQLRKILVDEIKVTKKQEDHNIPLPRSMSSSVNTTLYDVLLVIENQQKDLESYLIHYMGYYKKGDEEKTYDIIIKGILWEEKLAIMTIISENQTILKIKRLKEQSNYKDKLLATVSHDLRTPLNGVLGLIDLSISIAKDNEVSKM